MSETIIQLLTAIHAIIISVLFDWDKIKNPFSYSKKKKTENLIAIANCADIDENLKNLAKQELKNTSFSDVFGFSLNKKISARMVVKFIEKSKDAIDIKEDTIDINDFKLARPYLAIEDDKIKINQNYLNIMKWLTLITFVAFFFSVLLSNKLSTVNIFLLVIYFVFTILVFIYIPKQNKSIEKIKSEIARQQEL